MTKTYRTLLLGQALLTCLLLTLLMAPSALAQEEREYEDLALTGDGACTRCHDELEYVPVLSIAKTAHGTVADGRTPTCTSCHGSSTAHIDNPEGTSERPPVDRRFGLASDTPVHEQNSACLDCHQGGERIHWQGSAHDSNEVACASCHELHTQDDKVRNRQEQPEVCFACHKEQRMEVTRFSRHPIPEGKVICSDCHNAHGTAGPKLLTRDSVTDTCYQCHAEKRGPFIWNHQPVNEDCSNCHNPHGTNIAGMLKWRTPFLCQQCHEPDGGHRGAIPTLGSSSVPAAEARSCLNCHTNIHGGNSPTNNPAARSLRR